MRCAALFGLSLALLADVARAQRAEPIEQPPAPLDRRVRKEESGFDAADTALVSAPGGMSRLAGQPVRAISIELTGNRWQTPIEIDAVDLGEPLSAALARRAMREVYDTGAFAQVYADARPYLDGVVLRLVAEPRRIIAAIKLEGGELDPEQTLGAAGVRDGDEVTEATLRRLSQAIADYYQRRGYEGTLVVIEPTDTDDPLRVVLTIRIEPGRPRTVTRRIFVIDPAFDAAVGELKAEYAVEAEDDVDEDVLIEADNELAELLRSKGFLAATVKHKVLRQGPHTFLYVYLEPGNQFRFRFEGPRHFDQRELYQALGLEAGAEADPAELTERLRSFYLSRGYYDVRIQAEQAQGDEVVRELRFAIHEGEPVQVVERLLPCLPLDAPEDLQAEELGAELNAELEETLPSASLLVSVDEPTIDNTLGGGGGARAPARRLAPAAVYDPDAYERALDRLRKLLNSKGYLNAVVGPVSVIRAECDPAARGGLCQALELPEPLPAPRCQTDALDLPLGEGPLPELFECKPDPTRGLTCAPVLALSIPIQLGPRTTLYDMVFEGNRALGSGELLELAGFPLGSPFSNLELDAAIRRIVDRYRDLGYAYATVRSEVERSPDRTRARVRFVLSEHEPVVISDYEVRGAVHTDPELILGRLALCPELDECADADKTFRLSLVRESEQQIATLGTFSSVSITLEDPDIPQARKRVIIAVVEQRPQYLETRGGFSTGEGFRGGVEYGHRNVGRQAIALTLRIELAFLPEFLILDDDVRDNYEGFLFSERLERRNSGSLRFPDIKLGPKVDLTVDALDVRDNQRDFGLTREALIPTLSYRPLGELSFQLGASGELNDVTLFGADDVEAAIVQNPALANILRVPQGRTLAVAQRIGANWDRRDNAFSATEGTLASLGVEHVSAFPLDDGDIKSEFLKLTARGAGYLRLSDGGVAVALSLAGGYNLQLTDGSKTYPDRLFYLGGVSTLRGFQLDALVPEDLAQKVLAGEIDIGEVGVRGGDLFVNPRAELRVPLTDVFGIGVFLDAGNVWSTEDSIDSFADVFKLRYASGAGVRIATPVGPVALDYGINLVRREWEDFGAFHFAIGLF